MYDDLYKDLEEMAEGFEGLEEESMDLSKKIISIAKKTVHLHKSFSLQARAFRKMSKKESDDKSKLPTEDYKDSEKDKIIMSQLTQLISLETIQSKKYKSLSNDIRNMLQDVSSNCKEISERCGEVSFKFEKNIKKYKNQLNTYKNAQK